MANDNELIIKINGDVKGYKDALKAATKETEDLQLQFDQLAKIGAVVFAGFIGTIVVATSRFAEFDHGLRGVKTLLDESSFSTKTLDEGFQNLGEGALDALSKFPLALQSLNKSLFDIVSAGIPAAKAIGVLGSTSRLAVAGITESSVATDGVTSALNAYGLQAEESELIAAKFFTAQKFGKTTIEELSSFFGVAASSASEYGVSLDELLAATAAATTGGIKTRTAFFSLVAALNNLSKPTEDAIEEAERLGIEFSSTAIRTKGLKGFLDELTSSQNFNKQSIEKLFGSVEAQKIIFSITGAQAGKFKQTLDELSDSQKLLTTFTRAYEEQSKSLKNQVVVLKNNFDALAILIGKNLAPIIESLASSMTVFLSFLQNNPGLADFVSKILVAGTVAGGLALAIGLAGLAFLKYRAVVIASTVATKGMSFAVKSLVGSTGLGLFVAFLPEISGLLDNSLVPALALTAAGLYKTRAAMLAAQTATQGMAFAVKGLIGSTGLGLLVAFLPEIIELFKIVFGGSTKIVEQSAADQKKIALQQAKDALTIANARTRGASEIEIDFLKRRQDLRNRADAAEKIRDGQVRKIKLRELALLNEQLFREEREFQDKNAVESTKLDKKVTDSKLQSIRDENERINAALAGAEKERVVFIQRRQEIQDKAREAEAEEDGKRQAAMLENVRLLQAQLLVDEKSFVAKQAEIRTEKSVKDAETRQKEEGDRQKRILGLRNENEILAASLDDQEKTELDFIKRRQEIRDQTVEAGKLRNVEERDASLENMRLKNEALFFEEAEHLLKLDELRRENEEAEAALQAELAELSAGQREALQQAELDELKRGLESREKIRSKATAKELLARRKENDLYRKDEEKFGKTFADIKAFFRKEEFTNAQTAASALAQLQQSENASLKAIGKAAALVQIGINTQKGAIAAYSALAGIPIVGPALGVTAAAALTAYGVERAAAVSAAQSGGRVEGSGFGDRMPFLLEPGELITPRQNFEEVVTAVADQRAAKRETEDGGIVETEENLFGRLDIGFDGDEAADVITIRQNEQEFLGVSRRLATR